MKTATRHAMLTLVLACGLAGPAHAQAPVHLTLRDAEARAVQDHPLIRTREYTALAAGEVGREVRSAYFPAVFASATAADAHTNSRIAAGGLNNPIILDRGAFGVAFSQMITDFGRTSALSATASLRVDAERRDVAARRADVLLEVDRAFFAALRAEAIQRVAEQTVATRQLSVDQVTAQAASGLKSALDVSFAQVNLSEARLLLSQARNEISASFARLSSVLGMPPATIYQLAGDAPSGSPAQDSAPLIVEALRERPDVASERLSAQAAERFAAAEGRLWLPTVSVLGAAGMAPYHQSTLVDRYAAVAANVTIAVTNGNYFAARKAEASFRVGAQQQRLRDLETRVARDVQVAWLDARTAYERLDLTSQLQAQAAIALDLAQQRFTLGVSSIIELTQAQLNQTRADIEKVSAQYEYEARLAILRYQMGALR